MTCPGCQQETRDGAAFCGSCGHPLERACPGCGRANPARNAFCEDCGAPLALEDSAAPAPSRPPERVYTPKHLADKILQSKSALEGERKQVTVLFADVKGSMALSEEIDAESWHGVLDGFFAVLAEGVHRFEGTINQYTGDGIMALFGAPIAHEDHAQRTCYAALQLQEELARYAREVKREHGLGFSVRMGIHSGEVVVGKIGDDLRMDYTAQGHTVGLAARMQELASPDTAYLTRATAELVSGYFELDDLGEFDVKGVADPVQVFQLGGIGAVRTRFDASRARGLTRFVGRDDDMQTLEAALARAREGNGQVVGLVADAGVGKSRLCFEFLERCRAEGLRVFQGGGVAHGKNIPLLPILQVFREYYGIEAQDTDQQVREKIAGRMLLFDEEYREVLPILFEFFGAPDPDNPAPRMDPEARQRQLFGVLRRTAQRDTTRGSIVTLIEDLHWIDGASEAWLEQWVDAIAGTQNLLVVNFRPEYRAEWTQKSWYHQIPLAPLGPEAIRELLDDLLGADPSLEGLAESIHDRTAGNPFFTEEVVQSLVESGHLEGTKGRYRLVTPIERLEVPSRVQPVLAARIDRLPEREKQVLQTAAVIGQEFAEPLLEQVAELPKNDLDEALRALKAAEFIYEESLFPVAEYAFKHPLTQAVALDSQLRERRRRVHRAVASTIEALDADRLDERAALLAHHWEEAGQSLTAARWHRRAAEWSGKNDLAEASRHWRRVLELARESPDSEEAAQLGAVACHEILLGAMRLGVSREEQDSLFEEGKRLAEVARDVNAQGILETAFSILENVSLNMASCIEHAREGERLLLQNEREEFRVLAPWTLIWPRMELGELEEARKLAVQLEEATRAHPDWGFDLYNVCAYGWSVWVQYHPEVLMGDVGRAREFSERGIELARLHRDPELEGWALCNQAELARVGGDAAAFLGSCRRSIEIAENMGSVNSQVYAYARLGAVLTWVGELDEAIQVLEHALGLARERRAALDQSARCLLDLAEAVMRAGDLARARALAEEAIEVASGAGFRIDLVLAQCVLARVLLRQEGARAAAEIERALDEADRLVQDTGARNLGGLLLLERAELARAQGDAAARERHLRAARALFEAMSAPARVAEIDALLIG